MTLNPPDAPEPDSLKQDEFDLLRNCVREKLGIKMPDSKKPVLEARLQKRLRLTGIRTFSQYCQYLFSGEGEPERRPRRAALPFIVP
jgi:chemotaxis protein methyltransferase CheR